jgi:hypothetical protein
MSVTDNIDSGMKHLMDWISISATITTLFGWLTPLGALLPIIWYSIRIYETETFQQILGRKKDITNGNDD